MENSEQLCIKFENLKAILQECADLGLDIVDLLKKVDDVIKTISGNEINIALVGSFSDGKTSAIAGLLGKKLSNMKIALDESSDEINVYLCNALNKRFRIIDTPGLFGAKEKEIDGKNVKFSDLTTKYISEAHIVIYVCDARNTLKDSHVDAIKYIMCDLQKLQSSIFVINKMDEAGYDLADEYDFSYGKEIKISALKKRLKDSLNLTDDELNALNVVCIAADPKQKGVENWFLKMEEYISLSHINDFVEMLKSVIGKSDLKALQTNVEKASVIDIVQQVEGRIENVYTANRSIFVDLEDNTRQMDVELDILHSELMQSRNNMVKRLDDLQSDIVHKLNNADFKTVGAILQDDLGIKGEEVDLHKLERNINLILSECSECNNSSISFQCMNIEKVFENEQEWIKNSVTKGSKILGNVKISSDLVKSVRNVCAKGHKFKPWGAVKTASKITKFLKIAGILITIFMEIYEWWNDYGNIKKYNELKEELLSIINDIFDDVSKNYQTDEAYYANFAPSYIELKEQITKRKAEQEKLGQQILECERLNQRLRSWFSDGEYVDFEIIPN